MQAFTFLGLRLTKAHLFKEFTSHIFESLKGPLGDGDALGGGEPFGQSGITATSCSFKDPYATTRWMAADDSVLLIIISVVYARFHCFPTRSSDE